MRYHKNKLILDRNRSHLSKLTHVRLQLAGTDKGHREGERVDKCAASSFISDFCQKEAVKYRKRLLNIRNMSV